MNGLGVFFCNVFLVLALSFSRCVVIRKICKEMCCEITEELKHIFLIRTFNPIPTGLGHVTFIYGLIQPMAGRNRVKLPTLNLFDKKIGHLEGSFVLLGEKRSGGKMRVVAFIIVGTYVK